MHQDRRSSLRRAYDGVAHIQCGGAQPRACRIIDISDGGVRLEIDEAEVSKEFNLMFPGPAGRTRECRMIWRSGREIGAEFIDTPQSLLRRSVRTGAAN